MVILPVPKRTTQKMIAVPQPPPLYLEKPIPDDTLGGSLEMLASIYEHNINRNNAMNPKLSEMLAKEL